MSNLTPESAVDQTISDIAIKLVQDVQDRSFQIFLGQLKDHFPDKSYQDIGNSYGFKRQYIHILHNRYGGKKV